MAGLRFSDAQSRPTEFLDKPRHDILSTSGNLSRLDFSGENPRMAPLIFRPKISPCTTLSARPKVFWYNITLYRSKTI